IVCFNAFIHGKLGRQRDGSMIASADPLKDEDREVALHFVKAAPVPVAELPLFIEERDCSPLAFFVDQFGALDWLGFLERTLKIRLAESAENGAQLEEESSAVPGFVLWLSLLRLVNLLLSLPVCRNCRAQENNGENQAQAVHPHSLNCTH